MPAKREGWVRICTTVPPGMNDLLKEKAATMVMDEADVVRQALRKFLDYDPRIHERGEKSGNEDE